MNKTHGLGYTRDSKGKVCSRHIKDIANTVTTYTGSGGNTDFFVLEIFYRWTGN